MVDVNRRGLERFLGVRLSRGKILPLVVAVTAACPAQPVLARNDGINPNRPEDNGIYWHGAGGLGIGFLGWRSSRCLDIPWYLGVPGTLGSAFALGLLREVAQHDWHLTKHQLAEGLAWGVGSSIGLGIGFTIEWGTGKRLCGGEAPRIEVLDRLQASQLRTSGVPFGEVSTQVERSEFGATSRFDAKWIDEEGRRPSATVGPTEVHADLLAKSGRSHQRTTERGR
jgi:hypothetical protein